MYWECECIGSESVLGVRVYWECECIGSESVLGV